MFMTRPKSPAAPRGGGGGPLSSRGGTFLLAGLLALLAAAALLVFLHKYRDDLTASDPVQVLVARSLVPKGTPGEVVGEQHLYRLARVKKSQLEEEAISDPDQLDGRAAGKDLYPGHQLTLRDFHAADETVRSRLTGFDRGISVPVDKAHGMVGNIDVGDRVDVITTQDAGAGSTTIARVATRNALVLALPDGGGSGVAGRDQQVTVRVPDEAASAIAAAADDGKVWLLLRPPVGARSHETDAVADGIQDGRHVHANVKIDAQVSGR